MKNIDPTPFPIEPPVSICPAGECFPLPNNDDEAADFTRLQKLVTEQRQLGRADIAALEDSLKVIGERISPDCLVLIETTVPPGTIEYVAYPIIKKAFEARELQGAEPLLAHSFERVMPGCNYVASIRDFWRVCSGITPEARQRVQAFLSE